MISEYSNGSYGWLMQSAFLGAGVGTVAIALGLRKTLQPGKSATISVGLLFAAGIDFFLAVEKNGWLHLIGSVIVFFTILIAAWGCGVRSDAIRHRRRSPRLKLGTPPPIRLP